jgi:hypothetical protein
MRLATFIYHGISTADPALALHDQKIASVLV